MKFSSTWLWFLLSSLLLSSVVRAFVVPSGPRAGVVVAASSGVLTVFLDRVENLKDDDGLGKSDPFIKFELEQDNLVFDKGYGKKQSSKKSNELNPVYGETFEFKDVPKDLNNMVLNVKVMDADIGFDDDIGSCAIKLEGMGLSSSPMEVDKIVDRKGLGILRKHARIYLKLSFEED